MLAFKPFIIDWDLRELGPRVQPARATKSSRPSRVVQLAPRRVTSPRRKRA